MPSKVNNVALESPLNVPLLCIHVVMLQSQVLSHQWFVLKKATHSREKWNDAKNASLGEMTF